ncbi:heterokaryon incompatibility protein-domain-containing protein [Podospora didyma]|uniref:Heterokaryon incompatibility protein-domain-containing protein n=1 Tax=Podospora didyma TaxID=330526 RepID=A0AAE0N750_9PEZI|nr:heterokaryon incompatibility protein-domain-containing protein [Podospora didyma]
MSRWHAISCQVSQVSIQDGVPRCGSCGLTPALGELMATNSTTTSIPPIPADPQPGQLSLWWPPSVPFATPASNTPFNQIAPVPQDRAAADKLTAEESTPENSPARPSIYGQSVRGNELRLLCLPAVDSYDAPLHLHLEVYDFNDCPEYETVSYTWAGEDGDGALRRPVYIGDHWDVLLQTQNCWDMLCFMRPWRGTRMLWVDAICIDQANDVERSSQVANMGKIYSACTSVVVYLGPDIAVPIQHRKHPRRHRLHELESDEVVPHFAQKPSCEVSLAGILKRRYFSRVWVIQELLLSQHMVMRVGDVDFWADAAMSARLSSCLPGWSWTTTTAPWVQFAAQGAGVIDDISALFSMTLHAQATDPRDRIFGLLGILPKDSTQKDRFQPDYSLSCQNVFLGFFAYCILTVGMPQILCHHAFAPILSKLPSWVPDWTLEKSWRDMFTVLVNPDPLKIATHIQSQPYHHPQSQSFVRRLKGPANQLIRDHRPWNLGAYVDRDTGALRINATQYLRLSGKIQHVGQYNTDLRIFAMEMKSQGVGSVGVPREDAFPHVVYLVSKDPLYQVVCPKSELFIVDTGHRLEDMLYLVVNPSGTDGPRAYRLVATCVTVFISDPSIVREELEKSRLHRVYPGVPRQTGLTDKGRSLELAHLQSSLFDMLASGFKFMDLWWMSEWTKMAVQKLFPDVSNRSCRDLLPTYAALWDGSDELEKHYLSCVSPVYKPRLESGYIVLTFSGLNMEPICALYMRDSVMNWPKAYPDDTSGSWEYRIAEYDWTSVSEIDSLPTFEKLVSVASRSGIDMRFPAAELPVALKHERDDHWGVGMTKLMRTLKHVGKGTGESTLSMVTRAPRDEDHFIGCASPGFPVELREDLGIFGSTYMISLV